MDAEGDRSAPGGDDSFDAAFIALPPAPLCQHCGNALCPCWVSVHTEGHSLEACGSDACEADLDDVELWGSQCREIIGRRSPAEVGGTLGPFMSPAVRKERYDPIELCELCGEECNDGITLHGLLYRMCPDADSEPTAGHTSLLMDGGW